MERSLSMPAAFLSPFVSSLIVIQLRRDSTAERSRRSNIRDGSRYRELTVRAGSRLFSQRETTLNRRPKFRDSRIEVLASRGDYTGT